MAREYFLTGDEANRYGFDWPSVKHPGLPKGFERIEGPHIQVTRLSQIDRGKKGVFRALQVLTEREKIAVYVTPTGKVRIFDAKHREWKPGA